MAGPDFDTDRSTLETTGPPLVEESFSELGSLLDETVAVFERSVPEGVPGGMWPVNVKFAVAPRAKGERLQAIVPPAPTAGVEHDIAGPLFCTRETKVIVPGSVS